MCSVTVLSGCRWIPLGVGSVDSFWPLPWGATCIHSPHKVLTNLHAEVWSWFRQATGSHCAFGPGAIYIGSLSSFLCVSYLGFPPKMDVPTLLNKHLKCGEHVFFPPIIITGVMKLRRNKQVQLFRPFWSILPIRWCPFFRYVSHVFLIIPISSSPLLHAKEWRFPHMATP